MAAVKKKTRKKAGTSRAAAAARKVAFAKAYIANGRNGLRAAIAAGFSEKGAGVTAHHLLKDLKVQAFIAAETEKAADLAGLSVERTLREVARLAYSDKRKFYDAKGNLIPVHLLGDDEAACVAAIEVDEVQEGEGEKAKVTSRTRKLKLWDKNAALEKAMKYHRLYREDIEPPAPTELHVHMPGKKTFKFTPYKGRARADG